jgi:DNA-binding NtrC family response regulator
MSHKTLSDISLLYVEDEPLISLDAMSALEKCGFKEIVCAYTLKSARTHVEKRYFDCAILDISLERGLSSLELGMHLSQKGTKVIIASGNRTDKEELEAYGFLDFFIKPYKIEEVIEKIEETFRI